MSATSLAQIQRVLPDAVAILATAPVLHVGWEMDNEAWAVRMRDGSISLVMTSHGRAHECDADEMRTKIAEYEVALEASRRLLNLLPPSP